MNIFKKIKRFFSFKCPKCGEPIKRIGGGNLEYTFGDAYPMLVHEYEYDKCTKCNYKGPKEYNF